MMKPPSWRKPVPPFIPSPPTSPTLGASRQEVDASRQELDVSPEVGGSSWFSMASTHCRKQLAPQWHDATTETRNIHHHHMQDDQTRSGHFAIVNPMNARQLPRIASPVYLGSTVGTQQARKHRVCSPFVPAHFALTFEQLYRPPTPPRSNSHKFPRLHRSDTNPEVLFSSGGKCSTFIDGLTDLPDKACRDPGTQARRAVCVVFSNGRVLSEERILYLAAQPGLAASRSAQLVQWSTQRSDVVGESQGIGSLDAEYDEGYGAMRGNLSVQYEFSQVVDSCICIS